MKIVKSILALSIFGILLSACSNDEVLIPEIEGNYVDGLIVSAEGNFGDKDGSISYVNNNLNRLATNFVYTGVNQAQLGGLIQSITFSDEYAYIILNDVNTIVVANKKTFEKVTEIKTGLKNPRYMAIVGEKGYVTNWGDGAEVTDDYLAIIDLSTNSITDEIISLDNGVEQIIANESKLYVSHKGAFTSNNIISVIDLNANNAITEITVKDNPDELFFDELGNLIVLSEGKPLSFGGAPNFPVLTNTTAAISFINVNTNTVEREIIFPENKRASLLAYENGELYYYMSSEKKVFEIPESSTSLATEGILVNDIYGMNVRDNQLFTVSYAFTSLSQLKVFNISSKTEVYATTVGLGASKIYYNN